MNLQRFLPGLYRLRQYKASELPAELAAGITIGVVMIPVGLAFGSLAGQPMAGLYASILPIVVFALFSGSRLLIVNPDASMSALIAASVAPLAVGLGELAFAQMIGLLGLMMGVLCVVGALCRVGFLADLLAKPVIVGFMHGTAVVIAIGQIPKALGIDVGSGRDSTWGKVLEILDKASEANLFEAAIALLSFALILACRRWIPRVPGQIIVLVAAPLLVLALGLEQKGVQVIGHIPSGLPSPQVPVISLDLLRQLLPIALMGSLLAFSDVMVLARAFAARHNARVDGNRELMSLGLANAASAFTQGLPVSGSGSRTAVAESAGGRGPLCVIVAALTVLLILAFMTPLLRPLPMAALAGILFAAAWNLCDFGEFGRLWRFRGVGLLVAIATMIGVVAVGMLEGILIGVGLSVVLVMKHLSVPADAELGRLPDSDEFGDIERNPQARTLPGVLVYRFSGPLFFANASRFAQRVEARVLNAAPPVQHVVLDASGIIDIDLTAVESLQGLARTLAERGIDLRIGGAISGLRDPLERGGVMAALGGKFYRTVDEAVRAGWPQPGP